MSIEFPNKLTFFAFDLERNNISEKSFVQHLQQLNSGRMHINTRTAGHQ